MNPHKDVHVKTLTPVEQSTLVAQAKAGDRRATEALLRYCERDVQGMVGKMKCPSADRDDLAQVARMAVLKSIQTFDSDAGMQFRFYAAQWAREDVRRQATTLSSVVVRNVRTRGSDLYLDAPVHTPTGDIEETTYLDTMASEEPTPEFTVVAEDESERLRQVLESIIKRLKTQAESKYDRLGLARDLVYNRLLSHDPVNLSTLSTRYGVARETVRKLEIVILNMLKVALVKEPS